MNAPAVSTDTTSEKPDSTQTPLQHFEMYSLQNVPTQPLVSDTNGNGPVGEITGNFFSTRDVTAVPHSSNGNSLETAKSPETTEDVMESAFDAGRLKKAQKTTRQQVRKTLKKVEEGIAEVKADLELLKAQAKAERVYTGNAATDKEAAHALVKQMREMSQTQFVRYPENPTAVQMPL